jgi:hypothetical protein
MGEGEGRKGLLNACEGSVLLAVLIIGFITLTLTICVTILLMNRVEAPTGLTTVIGAGVGALSTLLVSSRGGPGGPAR